MHKYANIIALKCFILFIIFTLGTYGVYSALGLFADGSHFLLNILTSNGYYAWDKPRMFAQVITQTPTVLALKLGVTDLNQLIWTHSFGLVAIPIIIWISSLLLQIRTNFFWLLALAFSFTYLNSGFFAIGEYNVTYAMVALSASLLMRRQIGPIVAGTLIATSFALTRSYEAMVFLGPMLFLISALRLLDKKQKTVEARIALLIAMCLFLSAASISAWSIIFPRDPANMQAAMKIVAIISRHQFLYLLLMSTLISIQFLDFFSRFDRIIMFFGFMLSLLFLIHPSSWNSPAMDYQFKAMSGLMLFLTLSLPIFLYLLSKIDGKYSIINRSNYSAVTITLVVFTLSITFASRTGEFYDWAKNFELEAIRLTGSTPIDKTRISSGAGKHGKFDWDWTNPTLSLLLRGNSDSIIMNNSEYHYWQPFDPEKVTTNPLGAYVKESRLYR